LYDVIPGKPWPPERATLPALNALTGGGIAPFWVPSESIAVHSSAGSTFFKKACIPQDNVIRRKSMTNAERQKAYRERQGWAGKRKERDRKRKERGTITDSVSVTNAPPVRYVSVTPREVQETHTVSFDDVEGDPRVMQEQRERLEKLRPPPAPPVRKDPEERVVAPVVITSEERRIEQWLEQKKSRRPAADLMSATNGIEVPWE
jgi:hypothetical protein